MKLRRGVFTGAVLLAFVSIPGRSCGPFFVQATFIRTSVNLDSLQRGAPTVVPVTAGTRDLAIAFRMLGGMPLTTQEWEIALPNGEPVKVTATAGNVGETTAAQAMGGTREWLDARATVGAGSVTPPVNNERTVPGSGWESFANCLPGAYLNAAKTLTARRQAHPDATTDLVEWVTGQDAVFSNCANTEQMPEALPASAPLWLRQDRAYQTAAAYFYRLEWPDAIAAFSAIAADKSSPWHDMASYLVARTLVRQASLGEKEFGFDPAPMREAERRLLSLSSGRTAMAPSALQLLDYVQVRVSPGTAAARLGDRISKPDPSMQQDLIDLRYAFNHIALTGPLATRVDELRSSELADWVFCMRFGAGPYGDAAQRWRKTRNIRWLVPAIATLKTPQADLMQAAADVPHDSPAWATVTYYRLKLLRYDPSVHAEIESVRTELTRRNADLSTQNLFKVIAFDNSATPGEFMTLAPMRPVAVGYDDDEADFDSPAGAKVATMAGLPVNTQDDERVNLQAAIILNQQLPLSALVSLTTDSNWPKQLRFELAMAVWTRAVLLNQPDEARLLTPLLIKGEPGWESWLTAYDGAATPDDRTVTALLALMRFPSVRPYINAGAGREEGFVGYSSYRDNWWCASMGAANNAESSYSTGYNSGAGNESNQPSIPSPQPPSFVTAAMAREADEERAQLMKIGDGPTYFGRETLAWVRSHSKDARAPELLGFALRAMRNGCNLEGSVSAQRQIVNTLHEKYPTSEWATHRD